MKTVVITFLAILLCITGISAQTPSEQWLGEGNGNSFSYRSFHGYNAVGPAFVLSPAMRDRFAGNRVTAMKIFTAKQNENMTSELEIFVTEQSPALVFTTPRILGKLTVDPARQDYFTATLASPYEITRGENTVFIGIRTPAGKADDYYFAMDYDTEIPDGDDSFMSNGFVKFSSADRMNADIDRNPYTIWMKVEGNSLPVNDVKVTRVQALDMVASSEPFKAYATLKNDGANNVTSVKLECTLGGEPAGIVEHTFKPALEYLDDETVKFDAAVTRQNVELPLTVRVIEVNGTPVEAKAKNTGTTYVTYMGEGVFERTVAIEEYTSTGCGWCVRGYVAMDELWKKYGADGRLAIVSVHGYDAMSSDDFASFRELFAYYPRAYVNRKGAQIDPSPSTLLSEYESALATPAKAKIELTASLADDGESVVFDSESTFGYTAEGKNYGIAYIITEDGLGPYMQYNSYSSSGMEMAGFESKPIYVSLNYDFIGSRADNIMATESAFDGTLEAGTPHRHTKTLTKDKIADLGHCRFIALLINRNNGVVENAAVTYRLSTASADIVIAPDNDAPAEYFDIRGLRVAQPSAPGIYIMRRGTETRKIIVR